MDQPRKTLADYVVVAISPILIMLLVGSLVFFLIQVFYRGEMVQGVRFAMFWFVLAIVLITRIGIEFGKWQARLYGAALAAATWICLAYTHKSPVLGAILLAITWWCAHRLTVDCTLVPETSDDGGYGAFQNLVRGLGKQFAPTSPGPGLPPLSPLELLTATELAWRRARKPARRPGRWVFYFSLAALPLFGIGQLALPQDDPSARRMAFAFLALYLGAAFGLLITTSFLGLRRSLRQHSVEMPAGVARAWIKFGARLAVGVLLVSLILPRPGALHAIKELTYRIPHREHKASEHALPFNPAGSGFGAQTEQPIEHPQNSADSSKTSSSGGANNARYSTPSSSGSGRPSGEPGTSGSGGSGGGGSGGGGSGGGGGNGGGSGNDAPPGVHTITLKDVTPSGDADNPADNKTPAGPEAPDPKAPEGGDGKIVVKQSADHGNARKGMKPPERAKLQPVPLEKPTPEPPKLQPNGSGEKEPTDLWSRLFRLLLMLAAVIAAVWALVRFRKEIGRFIRAVIAAVRDFFRKLFRRRPRRGAPAAPADVTAVALEPFAAFQNPFVTGKAAIWPRERILRYTYEAIQAWAKEQGVVPRPEQTPREFCAQLVGCFPEIGPELEELSFYYAHVAFARQLPADFEPASLRPLWDRLGDSVMVAPR
jgi:hypothetical protein